MTLDSRSKVARVLAAGAVLAILGGALAVRLINRPREERAPTENSGPKLPRYDRGDPPPVVVPPAAPVDVSTLAVPCWSCYGNESWAIRFRTNLDLIAPLGPGRMNAAEWFKDFAPYGARAGEATAAIKRHVKGPGDLGEVLPANEPLVREAEPWCDQAEMRFTSVFPARGGDTRLPNLLLALRLGKAWVARGMNASDPGLAMADFQRAVRFGRLLRQDDVTLIQDLIGLACIRYGTEQIYALTQRQGDFPRALAAAIVLGEASAQRLRSAERMTRIEVRPWLRPGLFGNFSLNMLDRDVNRILDVAKSDPDRRFRCEAIRMLNVVEFLGSRAQRRRTEESLAELGRSTDPVISSYANWSRSTKSTIDMLQSLAYD